MNSHAADPRTIAHNRFDPQAISSRQEAMLPFRQRRFENNMTRLLPVERPHRFATTDRRRTPMTDLTRAKLREGRKEITLNHSHRGIVIYFSLDSTDLRFFCGENRFARGCRSTDRRGHIIPRRVAQKITLPAGAAAETGSDAQLNSCLRIFSATVRSRSGREPEPRESHCQSLRPRRGKPARRPRRPRSRALVPPSNAAPFQNGAVLWLLAKSRNSAPF